MILIELMAVPIAILSVGAFILIRGLRPGRIGNEPRCRRCEYELQGIDSERCPECGSPLSPSNIVHGKRYRRPWTAVVGLLGLLIGLGAGGMFAWVETRQIDWNVYRPTSWLIDDLASTVPTTQQSAWTELNRRIATTGLSKRNNDRLADACLAALPTLSWKTDAPWVELMRQKTSHALTADRFEKLIALTLAQQQTPVPWRILGEMADVTAGELLAGRLSDQQRNTFLTNLMQIMLRVRTQANGTLPYAVAYQSRGPNDALIWYSETTSSIRIDGKPVKRFGDSSSSGQIFGNGGGSFGSSLDLVHTPVLPGLHTLQVQNHLRFHPGSHIDGGDDAQPVLMEFATDLSANFTVLPANVVEPIAMIHDASLGPAFRAAIHINDARLDGNRLSLSVDVQQCPTEAAFAVLAVIGKTETLLGSVSFHGGGNSDFYIGDRCPAAEQASGNTVDIVLRSSPEAARRTIEFTKIWDGDLTVRAVPFTRRSK